MPDHKWIKFDELRQPGTRRILEAMNLIRQEAPGLLNDASIVAADLSKERREGGHVQQ